VDIIVVYNTGELSETKVLTIDEKRIKDDELLDGYYAITTSETNLEDPEIIDAYSQLWKIEQNFRIFKTDLKTRPVFIWTKEHIEAHFLICYVALVIAKLLQRQLNLEYSIPVIASELKQMNAKHIKDGIYISDYPEIITKLEKRFNVSFNKKYTDLTSINKYRSDIFKGLTCQTSQTTQQN
jgi:transposase